ncbi:MAG: hypothetical protein E6Q97_15560 [Desulfurellales bacterium]|nr:MAG: hypothetical protein E6Q97_15560 [Desulfurellales bacterium]
MGKGTKVPNLALASRIGVAVMAQKQGKPKKTDVQINIRKNNPAGYVISVYRHASSKFGPSVREEFYLARTIEEVETITSSLLRSGSVPKELGGA